MGDTDMAYGITDDYTRVTDDIAPDRGYDESPGDPYPCLDGNECVRVFLPDRCYNCKRFALDEAKEEARRDGNLLRLRELETAGVAALGPGRTY